MFKWPSVYDIWLKYLTKFIARYVIFSFSIIFSRISVSLWRFLRKKGGSKIERLRDLFEQCLEEIPQKFAKAIYLLYAKLEENHGLAKRAVKIYERATEAVLPEERYEMYNIYIKQVASMKGVTGTREIFEKAIEVLPDDQVKEICTRYADMERKLGEIDRARAIYVHCSQLCDPKTNQQFWQTWKEFEIAHGNEDTVREMLRIKRSVQATYNVQFNFMAAQMVSGSNGAGASAAAGSEPVRESFVAQTNNKPNDQMKSLEIAALKEQKNKSNIQFVKYLFFSYFFF